MLKMLPTMMQAMNKIKKVCVFREFDDGLLDLRWQQLVIDKGGRNEGCEYRSGANIAKYRRALADFRAGEAADHEDGYHHGHFALDVAGIGEARQQSDKNDIDRNGDDPDPHVHDFPPPVRPPRVGAVQRLRRYRGRDALLHFVLPGELFSPCVESVIV